MLQEIEIFEKFLEKIKIYLYLFQICVQTPIRFLLISRRSQLGLFRRITVVANLD